MAESKHAAKGMRGENPPALGPTCTRLRGVGYHMHRCQTHLALPGSGARVYNFATDKHSLNQEVFNAAPSRFYQSGLS